MGSPLLRTLLIVPLLAALTASNTQAADEIRFNRDIRPILSDKCFFCHGPDKNKRKGGLRLDDRAAAIKKEALVPGEPDKSELWVRLNAKDKDDVMPPPDSHKDLSAEQKDLLRRWILAGAAYEPHWAYVPIKRPAVPAVKNQAFVRNPIDAFVAATLEARGIAPSPPADARTLARRLALDLEGLPPQPDDSVRAADPKGYAQLADKHLASPHFGERQAAPWLDVVRFSDTVGYHGDQNQNIFPYRDYVIGSFNADKPFDQFTIEQLAGDLLPNPTTEQLVATGFNRLNMVSREGGAQEKEYLAKYAADRVRAVGAVWMGTTSGCAECHDHKYDPFTARDFYSLSAFFADVKQWGVYSDYVSSPNKDLKGWSNDHPFPPELVVGSPYLHKRAQTVRATLNQREEAFARTVATKDQAAFAAWIKDAQAFIHKNPSGFRGVSPQFIWGGKDEQSRLNGDLIVLTGNPDADSRSVEVAPGEGVLTSLRLQLVPAPETQGVILRESRESTTIKLSATLIRAAGRREQPLRWAFADANLKSTRYDGGAAVLGVATGWKTVAGQRDKLHEAVFQLENPIALEAGDTIQLKLSGQALGAFRIGLSPLPFFAVAQTGPRGTQAGATFDAGTVQAVAKQLAKGKPSERAGLFVLASPAHTTERKSLWALFSDLIECREGRTPTLITVPQPPLKTRLLPRGNWQDESGPELAPQPPAFCPRFRCPKDSGLRAASLARWLVSPSNPLTARVIMNRLWQQFFGAGLSAVLNDLGAQGEPPSHPELLDWLAAEFMSNGYRLKPMIRLIVNSNTYRKSAAGRPELRTIDPNNRLLARQNARRLEAEIVRDNALAIAGLLNLDVGGPSSRPYQPAGYCENMNFPEREYMPQLDDRQYRRGVYTHWQRTFLHPMLVNFDAPSREECTADRGSSNTPQQALTLLNDPTFVEAARVFATELLNARGVPADKKAADQERINRAYQKAVGRKPTDSESASLHKLLSEERAAFAAQPANATALLSVGIAPQKGSTAANELAAWTSLCRVVLNLHETITRY